MSTKLPVLNPSNQQGAAGGNAARPGRRSRPTSKRAAPAAAKTNSTSASTPTGAGAADAAASSSASSSSSSSVSSLKVSTALKGLSPELQGKWSRVKARFHAVSKHIQASDLQVSIQWNNDAIGVTVTSPTRRKQKQRPRGFVEGRLSHKASSRFTNVGVDKSEPIVVQARTLFDLFDKDHSGHLDRLEFKKLIRAVGGDVGFSGAEFSQKIKDDFNQIDVGGDQRVSFAEFHRYYRFLHKELIARNKRKAREENLHQPHEEATKKDSEFYTSEVATLDDAIRANNITKVHEFVQNGEHFASGGLVPVVLAAHLGHFKITAYLAAEKQLDASLLSSEREAIIEMCHQKNKSGLNGLMHDLYTQACERLKVVESLNHDNLESARDNLKLTYYKNWGTHHKKQAIERASNVYSKATDNAQEALVAAANNNQVGEAERLLLAAADPNWQDPKGSTALMSATWFGFLEMCKLLVRHKAQVCIQNRRKNTALHFAAEKHHRDVVYFFLSDKCTDGVDALRIKNCLGNTPMKLCKDIYLQDLLIAAKPPDLKGKLNRDFRDQKKTGAKKDGYKNKAAEWVGVAARDNDLTSMQQHMGDFGPKQQQLINTPDFLGMYPLHYAAACAKSAVVKCLLDCKADMHVQSRTGNTPLHYAYNNNKKTIIKLLHEYEDSRNEENEAAKSPNKGGLKPADVGTFR